MTFFKKGVSAGKYQAKVRQSPSSSDVTLPHASHPHTPALPPKWNPLKLMKINPNDNF